MSVYKKKHIENNQLFMQYQSMIDHIQMTIRREIHQLVDEYNLSTEEITSLNEYVDDKATLFRYLRKNKYSLPTTLSLLLDTLRWRINESIDDIRISAVSEFLAKPLVYFHKYDKTHRPLLIIQLEYLPMAPDGYDVAEYLSPLITFVLETARQLTWDMTQQRMNQNIENPLILDTNVLINFKNASSLPTDISLFKSFIILLRRYPGLSGTINLINFGWMYQGIWQMCKLILSNDAKSRINFPSAKDLLYMIDEDDLMIALGGTDSIQWTIEEDRIYNQYRRNKQTINNRRESCASLYYDTNDNTIPTSYVTLSRSASSFSLYATPLASLTPVTSHTNLTNVAKVYSNLSFQSKIGGLSPPFRTTIKSLGDLFVPASDSYINEASSLSSALTERLEQIENNDTINRRSKRRMIGQHCLRLVLNVEHMMKHIVIIFMKKLHKYRITFCWVIALILVRNGARELLQNVFLLLMKAALRSNIHSAPPRIGYHS
ncbi:CRAL-TRIO domain-containing protein [Pilobolus umbonatus]|nr:CRAL-TRIO domain-containing protein [Pilobolus umbonatus]